MAYITTAALFFIVVGLVIGFIVYGFRSGASGIKMMLLGINITLLGGIIAVDPASNLGGIEYLTALAGLIISLVGFINDNKD